MVEREAGGGADVLEQPRIVEQLGTVDEHGDRPPAAHEWRDGAPVRLRQLDRVAPRVDMAARAERVGELERRVLERAGERVAQPAGRRRVAKLDDEPRDRRRAPAVRAPTPATTPSTSGYQRRRLPEPEPLVELSLERNPRPRLCA